MDPYILLIKSKAKNNIGPIFFAMNAMIALVGTTILVRGDPLTFGRELVLCVLSMLATGFSVYIYNDLTDIEIDKLNKMDRPLVTGEVSEKDTRNLVVALGIIGPAIAFLINMTAFLLVVTYSVLFSLYSFPHIRLKERFFVNKVTVGIGGSLSYLIGGAAAGVLLPPIYLMAAFGLIAALGMSTIMDLRDIKGDQVYKAKTLPIVWGPILSIRFAIAVVCAGGIAMVIGYLQLGYNLAFPVLASLVFVAWVYTLYPLFRHWNNASYIEKVAFKRVVPMAFLLEILTLLGAIL